MNASLKAGVSALALGVLSAGVLNPGQAAAQDAASMQAIQRQINELQTQLKQLQAEAKQRDAELRQARQAAQAQQAAQSQQPAINTAVPALPPGAAVVYQPANDKDKDGNPIQNPNKSNGKFVLGGLTITLGGFFDTTGYYRSRNQNRGTSSTFSGIPFNGPTPQGNTSEFNMTAQNTRISLRADGNINAESAVTGYFEMDFNNGAGGANSNQSYSYTPRLRQAFMEYLYNPQNAGWSGYTMAGQGWSLATPFKKGLDPFSTWQPPTLDTSYLPGYSYLRVPLGRAVANVGPAAFGAEIAAPQTIFGGTAPSLTNQTIYNNYAGNGGLNPQQNYSVNALPDALIKAAVDTPIGHFDAFGVARQFQNQISWTNTYYKTNGSSNHFANGGGFGGSMFIPIMKYADLQGNVMTGSGIGRYGAGGLPDVTYGIYGTPTPLRETMGTVGIVGHVLPVLDIYAFAGIDQIGKSYFGSSGGGYGNPTANVTGCWNPNAGGSGCNASNYQLTEFTVGYNWVLLKGNFGTIQTGAQYAYVERRTYGATAGQPSGIENMVFFNVRYIPF